MGQSLRNTLIFTPTPTLDTATSFIRSARTTSIYINTPTTQLYYPHIPSSNKKQSTNPKADFSETEESTDSDDNDDRLSLQAVSGRGRKYQAQNHKSAQNERE